MIIELLGLSIIVVLIAEWFGPIQEIKDEYGVYSWPIIGKILYCPKCLGLWLGLSILQDVYLAVIVSLLSYTISYLIDKMERDRYEN
jgi:hypothetical protein